MPSKLLFFDIECAYVTAESARICAFGYVLCDASFGILEKEDILINPKCGFHLTDPKGEKGLVLPYSKSEFRSKPTFYGVYRRIKNLLEDRSTIVIGHAIQNDVKYLNLERNNLRLPALHFSFFDTQILYMTMTGDFSHQYGLGSIASGLDVDYTPHRAVDDAYATMRIAEAMCKRLGGDFDGLLVSMRATAGRIDGNRLSNPTTAAFDAYVRECSAKKEERARKKQEFTQFLSMMKKKSAGKYHGLRFRFSRVIEEEPERSKPLVKLIYDLGGEYTQTTGDCDVYVRDEGDDTERTKKAMEAGVKMMTPDEIS
ncbi:MAG: 3'-5' exonuclease [Clostridia bacterium]|nr:3'-5' exonuclease [Clostridia bacterium]